jgi:proteic killer suppression protein
MEVDFVDPDLDRLETDPAFTAGHSPAIVRGFRKVMQQIRAAPDERDFYAQKGLQFEKLKGKRDHQRSMRINKQWRLILEINDGVTPHRIRIVAIEDYH